MRIRNSLGALALVAAFAATTPFAGAQSITLYNGSVINARLTQDVNSGTAHVGDVFSMTVMPPYPSGDPAFQGATITGVVSQVIPAGQGRNPQIVLTPQFLHMPDGTVANIYGNVTGIQANKSTQGTAAKAAAGALIGMLVGNAIFKTAFQSNAGGAIGLVGGAMYGANNKTNFTIPAGANATIQLSQNVTIRPQAAQPQ